MNEVLRAILKDWTPPVIRRRLRRESWGRVRYGAGGLVIPGGRRFTYRSNVGDRHSVRHVFFEHLYSTRPCPWDPELQRFYREHEQPLIIDAGAHIGAASVWFALSYPRATVIAVEPQEQNFEFLVANARAFPNILPMRAALASTKGTLFVNDPTEGVAGRSDAYRTGTTAAGIASQVEAVTLSDLVGGAPDTTPFICKVDVEGAEEDIFCGPTQLMDRFPLVIAELHDWMLPGQATSRNFLRWHIQHDRDLGGLGENVYSVAWCLTAPVASAK